jgi:hypothetical protein
MTTYKRGRGSNPASRNNLKLGASSRNWWVYERGAGIGWSPLFGPMFQREAIEAANTFESLNRTPNKPMYVATTAQH